MEDTNDRDMNFSENFVIISSRKTDFLRIFINKMKSENDKSITPNIILYLVGVVASLDPLLFVSPKEIKDGHLYLETSLEELNRERIGEEIARCMDSLVEQLNSRTDFQ